MFGYHGRYLTINLSSGQNNWQSLEEDILRRFIGGVGLAAYLMLKETPVGVEPLAHEAPLILSLGPLAGTSLTTSAKFVVAGKSPLTNRFNDALASSHFALAAKRTGMDALVLKGACSQPSIVVITDGEVRLESAQDYWGLGSGGVEKKLQQRLGPDYQLVVIGLAGENLVRFASISHGHRHAGRGGLGAVLGAKKVKAVAVAGSRQVSLADPARIMTAAKDLSQRSLGPATAKYRELGTASNLLTLNRLTALPTYNFQQGSFLSAA